METKEELMKSQKRKRKVPPSANRGSTKNLDAGRGVQQLEL